MNTDTDSEASLKDVVDQLSKRITLAEIAVARIEDARSIVDRSARFAKLAPAQRSLLREIGEIKTAVAVLQTRLSGHTTSAEYV